MPFYLVMELGTFIKKYIMLEFKGMWMEYWEGMPCLGCYLPETEISKNDPF